jgi:hypothetical protein
LARAVVLPSPQKSLMQMLKLASHEASHSPNPSGASVVDKGEADSAATSIAFLRNSRRQRGTPKIGEEQADTDRGWSHRDNVNSGVVVQEEQPRQSK